MKLSDSVHQSQSWVISEITSDFKLLDVWKLPAEGDRDDFNSFLEVMSSIDPRDAGPLTGALFWVRQLLGNIFGWDENVNELPIPGATETTLAERLPAELRDTATRPPMGEEIQKLSGFIPLYRTEYETAAEVSNQTVHGVLHLAWVPQDDGRYYGQLAVYVKPRGRLGDAYMALISPFRHLVVYPALMRHIRRAWESRTR